MRRRCYPSDTTIAEWALLEHLLSIPASETSSGGHPEKWPRREIVDAIRYLVDTGCKWRALPADFPPFQTVFGFYSRWSAAGVFNLIRDQLRRKVRKAMGTSPHPVAAVIDSQSRLPPLSRDPRPDTTRARRSRAGRDISSAT